MSQLPVISDCRSCGACCMEQESPPGYLVILAGQHWTDEDDQRRFREMPQRLRDELAAYGEQIMTGKPHPKNGACIWFNLQTMRCDHYAWRPSICRDDLQPGDDACREWRSEYGVR